MECSNEKKIVGRMQKKKRVSARRCRLMDMIAKWQGCMNTLAEHNEDVKLELLGA